MVSSTPGTCCHRVAVLTTPGLFPPILCPIEREALRERMSWGTELVANFNYPMAYSGKE